MSLEKRWKVFWYVHPVSHSVDPPFAKAREKLISLLEYVESRPRTILIIVYDTPRVPRDAIEQDTLQSIEMLPNVYEVSHESGFPDSGIIGTIEHKYGIELKNSVHLIVGVNAPDCCSILSSMLVKGDGYQRGTLPRLDKSYANERGIFIVKDFLLNISHRGVCILPGKEKIPTIQLKVLE